MRGIFGFVIWSIKGHLDRWGLARCYFSVLWTEHISGSQNLLCIWITWEVVNMQIPGSHLSSSHSSGPARGPGTCIVKSIRVSCRWFRDPEKPWILALKGSPLPCNFGFLRCPVNSALCMSTLIKHFISLYSIFSPHFFFFTPGALNTLRTSFFPSSFFVSLFNFTPYRTEFQVHKYF